MAFLFAVNICKCSSEKSCFIEVQRQHFWPSPGQAIGILIGVLLVIGRSLFLGLYEAKSLRDEGAAAFLMLMHLGEKMS